MKTAAEILHRQKGLDISGEMLTPIAGIAMDSRQVREGFAFFAIRGTQVDGHLFIPAAIAAGAAVIVCENDKPDDVSVQLWVKVSDASVSLAMAAVEFYDNPAGNLKLIGVTGTNGKSSIVTFLYQLFTHLGYKCGLLSTVENKIGEKTLPATHTTPDAIAVNKLLAEMVAAGCDYAFMECSSHAIDQNRVAGLAFTGTVFTNLTHDHLDYHKTFDNYLRSKKKLFDNLPHTAFALINKDDRHARIMVQNSRASIYSYALKVPADFKSKILEAHLTGTLLEINEHQIWVIPPGEFNASNLTAVYGVAFLLGVPETELIKALTVLRGARGRFQLVNAGTKPMAVVDYAHTPDALENLLETINRIRTRNEQLLLVVGCGGNRDAAKRPTMGEIAARLADRVIFTSDNPRDEAPEAIIEAMQKGVSGEHYKKTLAITDRRQAIRAAVQMAMPDDIIVVAGKGHETYQEIAGVKHDFDDCAVLMEQLNLQRQS